MSDAVLKACDLHYFYQDGTHALKGLNIEIKRGITTAILGGNGAGKSTLFLNLNGILKPSSGSILHNGRTVDYSRKDLKELRKSVGLVFQDPDSQLFSANVFQDVSFGVMNMKLPEQEVRRRVSEAMEKTGVESLKNKPTHNLSYGQKKRVAIAGILAMEPEVLVLDEPTAGLDPMGASEIMKLVKNASKQMNLSVVVATHDIDMVPLYCDYVYVMDDGKIISEGNPEKIFSNPDMLRKVNLRLPRIAHLMEILHKEDNFDFSGNAATISEARRELKKWRELLR